MMIDQSKTNQILDGFSIRFRDAGVASWSAEYWNWFLKEITKEWEDFVKENKRNWGEEEVEDGTYLTLEAAIEAYKVELLGSWTRERQENMYYVEVGLFERYKMYWENTRDFENHKFFENGNEPTHDDVGDLLVKMDGEAKKYIQAALQYDGVISADRIPEGQEKRYISVSEFYKKVEVYRQELRDRFEKEIAFKTEIMGNARDSKDIELEKGLGIFAGDLDDFITTLRENVKSFVEEQMSERVRSVNSPLLEKTMELGFIRGKIGDESFLGEFRKLFGKIDASQSISFTDALKELERVATELECEVEEVAARVEQQIRLEAEALKDGVKENGTGAEVNGGTMDLHAEVEVVFLDEERELRNGLSFDPDEDPELHPGAEEEEEDGWRGYISNRAV